MPSEKFFVSGVEKPYAEFGPAFSRAHNEALKRTEEDTIFVTLDGEPVGQVRRLVKGQYLTEARQLR